MLRVCFRVTTGRRGNARRTGHESGADIIETGCLRHPTGKVYTEADLESLMGFGRYCSDRPIRLDRRLGKRRIAGRLMSDAVPEHTAALRILLLNLLPRKGSL
jgi:hypothetical protein